MQSPWPSAALPFSEVSPIGVRGGVRGGIRGAEQGGVRGGVRGVSRREKAGLRRQAAEQGMDFAFEVDFDLPKDAIHDGANDVKSTVRSASQSDVQYVEVKTEVKVKLPEPTEPGAEGPAATPGGFAVEESPIDQKQVALPVAQGDTVSTLIKVATVVAIAQQEGGGKDGKKIDMKQVMAKAMDKEFKPSEEQVKTAFKALSQDLKTTVMEQIKTEMAESGLDATEIQATMDAAVEQMDQVVEQSENVDLTPPETFATCPTATAPVGARHASPKRASGASGACVISSLTALIKFTCDDVECTFFCSVDGDPYEICDPENTVEGFEDGPHKVDVIAADAFGNADETSASLTFVVLLKDSVPPETDILAEEPLLTASTTITVDLSGSDAAGAVTYECKLDSPLAPGAFAPCASPLTLSLSEGDGEYLLTVRAKDAAGNVDGTPDDLDIILDTVAPETSFVGAGIPALTGQTSASFEFSCSDPLSTQDSALSTSGCLFFCQLDTGTPAECTSPVVLSVSEGSHTFFVSAEDAAGNEDETPESFSWTVDTSASETTLTVLADALLTTTSVTFTFSSADTAATFQCSLDAGGYSPCTSPAALTGLTEGVHTFSVRTVDGAGNADKTPASYTFWVDLTPPGTEIVSVYPPTSPTSATSMTIEFYSSDLEAQFECALDDEPFVACTSPATVAGLTDGLHTVLVRSVDDAGNPDASAATYTWEIDSTLPAAPYVALLTFAPDPLGLNDTLTGSPGAVDSDVAVEVYDNGLLTALLGSGQANADGSFSAIGLGNVTKSAVYAIAVDDAGNISPPTEVDTGPPDTFIDSTSPNADPNNSTSLTVYFSSDDPFATFECSLDGGAYATCLSPETETGLLDGNHTVSVRATDAALNINATPATYTWTIDTSAPSAPVGGSITVTQNAPGTNDQVSGTSASVEANSTVKVYSDALLSALIAQTSALGDGSIADFDIGDNQAEGSDQIFVTATDASGSGLNVVQVSIQRASDSFYWDGVSAWTGPLSWLNATGTSSWSYTAVPAWADGNHTIQARATDTATNLQSPVSSSTFTFVNSPPAAPVAGNLTVMQNAPGTADQISGSAGAVEANATVKVYSDALLSALIAQDSALADGSFGSTAIGDNQTDGSDLIYVTATDAAGNQPSATSMANDKTPPTAPAFDLSDQSSASTLYTNALLVDVNVTGSCVGISAITTTDTTSAPAPASVTTACGNTTHTLPAGDGVKTAYLWAKDAAGNVSTYTSVSIVLDTGNPVGGTINDGTGADVM